MSEKNAFNLVPESVLLETLPAHLQKRFQHALELMYQEHEAHLTWQEIAQKSAISSYHFHRQFTQLFNETPGQYVTRVRLQFAVNKLMSRTSLSITDVALSCGFSSSQALAKSLKRTLALTAKQVRDIGVNGTPKQSAEIIEKLAHPSQHGTMEKEPADTMPYQILEFSARGMKTLAAADADWEAVIEQYMEKSVNLMGATPINSLDKQWQEISTVIGDRTVPEQEHSFTVPAGHYLCCDVYLATDAGYSAALDGLFAIAERENLSVIEDAYLLEVITDVELTELGGVTLSLQLPINWVPKLKAPR